MLIRCLIHAGLCRLIDGFQDPNPAPALIGAPGQYVDTGLDTVKPVQQYSHTRPLVLPENLTEVLVCPTASAQSTIGAGGNVICLISVQGSADAEMDTLTCCCHFLILPKLSRKSVSCCCYPG